MLYSHAELRRLADNLTREGGPSLEELRQAALGLHLLLNTVEVMREVLARQDAYIARLVEANRHKAEHRQADECECPRSLVSKPGEHAMRQGRIVLAMGIDESKVKVSKVEDN
jgi:hypothetical protein